MCVFFSFLFFSFRVELEAYERERETGDLGAVANAVLRVPFNNNFDSVSGVLLLMIMMFEVLDLEGSVDILTMSAATIGSKTVNISLPLPPSTFSFRAVLWMDSGRRK